MAEILFHVPGSWLRIGGSGLRPFYIHVLEGLKARNICFDVRALDRETLPETVAADRAIHVVHHGRFAHARVRNADVAYIYPFWNFDPKGIRAFSSIADMPFHRMTSTRKLRALSFNACENGSWAGGYRAIPSPRLSASRAISAPRYFCNPKATGRSTKPVTWTVGRC